MNHAFMGAEPAELGVLRKILCDRSEIRHQLFNFPADQFLAKPFNRFANQLVSQAEREHDAGAEEIAIGSEQGGGKGVLSSRVDCIAARALLEGESHVACFQ